MRLIGHVLPPVLPGSNAATNKALRLASPELAAEIERAAGEAGITFSGWLAATASHRLRIEAGRRAIAEWERDQGPLTASELADGLARARALLGRKSERKRRST